MNWWLVANHLKHGMMTVRPAGAAGGAADHSGHEGMAGMAKMDGMEQAGSHAAMEMGGGKATRPPVPVMTLLSFIALAIGGAAAFLAR
jgi:hypothetical protein